MSPFPWNSIDDLRGVARSRIPRALFDYIDRGSYDELTWNRNRDDLRGLQLRQRVMVDVSRISTGTTVLGEHWNLPVGLAPTGLTGLFHRDGEIEAARAAQRAGVPFTLSTMSICSLEDVLSHPEHFECATCGNEWPRDASADVAPAEVERVVKDANGNETSIGGFKNPTEHYVEAYVPHFTDFAIAL